jgi:hypothetical protein
MRLLLERNVWDTNRYVETLTPFLYSVLINPFKLGTSSELFIIRELFNFIWYLTQYLRSSSLQQLTKFASRSLFCGWRASNLLDWNRGRGTARLLVSKLRAFKLYTKVAPSVSRAYHNITGRATL